MRHLLQHYGCGTTGATSFSGDIGIEIGVCHTLPIAAFDTIQKSQFLKIDEQTKRSLSSDQRYLLLICEAVISGNMTESFASRVPGPLNHSRWLTTASRLLRLYVTKTVPSIPLKRLCHFVILGVRTNVVRHLSKSLDSCWRSAFFSVF